MARIPYTEFDRATGQVTRRGLCQERFVPAPKSGRAIVVERVDPWTQHVECDGVDGKGRAIAPRIVPGGRPRRRRPPKPEHEQPAALTQGQYGELLARVAALEAKAK